MAGPDEGVRQPLGSRQWNKAKAHANKTGHATTADTVDGYWRCLHAQCRASGVPQPQNPPGDDDGGETYYDLFVDGRGF